jgi:hypothetical protein
VVQPPWGVAAGSVLKLETPLEKGWTVSRPRGGRLTSPPLGLVMVFETACFMRDVSALSRECGAVETVLLRALAG